MHLYYNKILLFKLLLELIVEVIRRTYIHVYRHKHICMHNIASIRKSTMIDNKVVTLIECRSD